MEAHIRAKCAGFADEIRLKQCKGTSKLQGIESLPPLYDVLMLPTTVDVFRGCRTLNRLPYRRNRKLSEVNGML